MTSDYEAHIPPDSEASDRQDDMPDPPEIKNINRLDEVHDGSNLLDVPPKMSTDDVKLEIRTKQTIDEIIEAAVSVSMEAFKRRHPTSYRYIIRRLGDPLEFTIKALKEDELYQQLIANTEEALDVANIIRVVVSVALSVAERLLIAL